MLFGTTDEFLKRFQIESINQLPDYEEILKQVETIESDKSLYNEFEIEDDEQVLINGQYVSKKSMTLEELNGERIKERREQSKKDDVLLEDLLNSQKALENLNKHIQETVLNPKLQEQETPQNKELSKDQINTLLENSKDEIPAFLKSDKTIQKVE